MNHKKIVLISIGSLDLGVIERVRDILNNKLDESSEILVPVWHEHIPLSLFDFVRGEYRARDVNLFLFGRFKRLLEDPESVIVGILDSSGYVEDQGNVYGYTIPELKVVTIYVKNLKSNNEDIFTMRVAKVVLRELGKLLGEKRCKDKCTLRFNDTLREIDEAPLEICVECE